MLGLEEHCAGIIAGELMVLGIARTTYHKMSYCDVMSREREKRLNLETIHLRVLTPMFLFYTSELVTFWCMTNTLFILKKFMFWCTWRILNHCCTTSLALFAII